MRRERRGNTAYSGRQLGGGKANRGPAAGGGGGGGFGEDGNVGGVMSLDDLLAYNEKTVARSPTYRRLVTEGGMPAEMVGEARAVREHVQASTALMVATMPYPSD